MAKHTKTATLEIPDEEFDKPKSARKARAAVKEIGPDEVGDTLGVRDEPEIDEAAPLDLEQDFSQFDAEDPEWTPSDEVREIAEELIAKHYRWIDEEGIYIRYVLSDKMVKKNGACSLGKMTVVSAFNARLADRHDKFFCMVVSRPSWERMARRHKIALVDHELSHCDYTRSGEDGPIRIKCRGHDLEEFVAVYRRHGAWASNVREFLDARPTPLFDHAGEV